MFDSWSQTDAELCTSAYETLLALYPAELDPYQRVVYAHILMLKGKYAEALDLCERSVSEASASGVGQVVNFLAHFGALSARIIVLFRTGQLGKVLQITKSGRASPDENLSLYWLLTLREAMLHAIAFDFEGARQICQAASNVRGREFPDAQYYAIDQIAAGNILLRQGRYSEALEHFRHVQDLDPHTKFFMHWEWRMMADFESGNAWLLSGNAVNARTAADGYLKSALSTSDPHLQALGWELQARVALAESDLQGARASIQKALAIIDRFEILSRPGKSLRLHRRFAGTRKNSKRPKRTAIALNLASSRLPIPSNRTNHFAQHSSPRSQSAGYCTEKSRPRRRDRVGIGLVLSLISETIAERIPRHDFCLSNATREAPALLAR